MRDDHEINLQEYLEVIKKRKKAIVWIVAASFAISVIVSLVLPKSYRAVASVLPPQAEGVMSAMVTAKLAGGFDGVGLGGLLGGNSHLDIWVGILKSNSVLDSIISRFKLKEVYGVRAIEDARESLSRKLEIRKSKEEILSIAVVDTDPVMAAQLANAFVEELDNVNKRVSMTGGQRTRVFLEERLTDARKDLDALAGELRRFQEGSNAISIDEQSRAVMEAIGQVKGQVIAKEVELETLLSFAKEENPLVKTVRTELKELKKKQREFETGRGSGIFIPVSRIPKLSIRYAELIRDLKVQETLFELLTQQYEMAKIQEAKDSPTVQVLDVATPPEKKYKPKRSLIVLSSTLLSVFVGVLYAFISDYRDRKRAGGVF